MVAADQLLMDRWGYRGLPGARQGLAPLPPSASPKPHLFVVHSGSRRVLLQEEILTLMLRYVGAAAPVYSLFLPLAVHIMVVSTHSVFSTVTIAIKVQST